MTSIKKTAIFVMPRPSNSWEGAEAVWITVAGWAAAAKELMGKAEVITPDRTATPKEVLDYPLKREDDENNILIKSRMLPYLPESSKTVLKDVLLWKKSRDWEIAPEQEYEKGEVRFVWEHHDLFAGKGRNLAKRLNVPYILYVHAPVVWESAKWGVKRGIWGQFLEKYVERDSFLRADLIAVVSENVKKKIISMGIPAEKILVSPMAVDPYLFEDVKDAKELICKELNLEGKTVIGWTGSFRGFHGLHFLIKAFQKILLEKKNCVLLLVGDGAERQKSEELVASLGMEDSVIFTGRKPFREIPSYVSVFDIAVVSAGSVSGFHYSPLKMREYLAAGKPVLAPNAGEIPQLFDDEVHLKLFEAGEVESLYQGLKYFLEDQPKREKIGREGREFVLKTSTWEVELKKSLEILERYKK